MKKCEHMHQIRLIAEHKLFGPIDWCANCGAVKKRWWARGQRAKLQMVNKRATWRLPSTPEERLAAALARGAK